MVKVDVMRQLGTRILIRIIEYATSINCKTENVSHTVISLISENVLYSHGNGY